MASIPIPARAGTHAHLRPLNILRDLPAVADLIELCFSDTMDREGQRYVQDMRRAGRDDRFLRWATRMAETTSLPLTGYVWEENGKMVGNASLVPFRHRGRRLYLIANVAVHPGHRRGGIAKALTERCLDHARERRVSSIWLHVRDDNPGAIRLYSILGFRERARRTAWQGRGDFAAAGPASSLAITDRPGQHWPQQLDWLKRAYPESLAWYRSWNFSSLQPGLWNWLVTTFMDLNIRQWSAMAKGTRAPEGILAWIPAGAESNGLWLAAPPNPRPDAITGLLLHARQALAQHLHLSLDYPAGESEEAIRLAGFSPIRTLIWMQYMGAP